MFQDFISTVDSVFPYVTLVLSQRTWPPLIPTSVRTLSQRVALHLGAQPLPQRQQDVWFLMDLMDTYDLVVQPSAGGGATAQSVLQQLIGHHTGKTSTHLYLLPARF